MAFKKEDKLLRIGILGCGPIAQFAHFESTQKARNCTLAAVCDRDETLANRFGAFYDAAKIYTDYDQMLADKNVDAIIIATADAFHVPAAKRALAAGKAVFCEKPIGVNVEEVADLAAAVSRTKLPLQVGHMLRFDGAIQSAHDFIQKEMGQILALKAWYCDSTHRYTMTDAIQPMPRLGKNALKPKGDPKADKQSYFMLAHGSHLVDLARWLAGPIKTVDARLVQKFGAYSWFVHTEFENGAMGHLDLTIPARADWLEGFQVYGEHGSVKANILNPWYYKSSEVDLFRDKKGSTERVLAADGHFYRRQLEGFADVVLHGKPMTGASIQDGLASVQAMAAIRQSVTTGKAVDIKAATGVV